MITIRTEIHPYLGEQKDEVVWHLGKLVRGQLKMKFVMQSKILKCITEKRISNMY